MEKLSSPIEEQDDLEIVSVGALYRGHWEKKYWSSSRVRLPHPHPHPHPQPLPILSIFLFHYSILKSSCKSEMLCFCCRLRIGTHIRWDIVRYETTLGPDVRWRSEKDRRVHYFWFDPIYIFLFAVTFHLVYRSFSFLFFLHTCFN
jgi:hypothetical protein